MLSIVVILCEFYLGSFITHVYICLTGMSIQRFHNCVGSPAQSFVIYKEVLILVGIITVEEYHMARECYMEFNFTISGRTVKLNSINWCLRMQV